MCQEVISMSMNFGQVNMNGLLGELKGSGLELLFARILQQGNQRAIFKATLLATVARVSKKPNFNLELEINDLFIKLGNLRGMNTPDGSNSNTGDLFHTLSSAMKSIGDLGGKIIK
jgi:hypothetical protein